MSRYYRKDAKDANHDAVCAFLRSKGVTVMEMERPLDLLLYYRGWTGWVEIKTESRNAQIKRGQIEFIATTPMPVAIVKNEAEAWSFVETGAGLGVKQKNKLAVFLGKYTQKNFYPATIENVLGLTPPQSEGK